MPSPYEEAFDLTGLHPRLRAYFAEIPAGMVGRGAGMFDVVGKRKRWLWPALAVLGRRGVVFANWCREVPFAVVNEPFDEVLSGRRTFHVARGDRTMVDLMSVVITAPVVGRVYEYSRHFEYRLEPVDV